MLCGMTDRDRRLLGARLVRTAEGAEIWDRLGDIWHVVKGKARDQNTSRMTSEFRMKA